jgi:hypothetical protein
MAEGDPCKGSGHRGHVQQSPLLILVPNFDVRGRCNNGGGLKLGMALNEDVSKHPIKWDKITYGYSLHKGSC